MNNVKKLLAFTVASLALLLIATGCATYAIGYQVTNNESEYLTIEDFHYMFVSIARNRGLYDIAETATLSPEILDDFSSLEDWKLHLENDLFPTLELFAMESTQMIYEMNQFGYMPNHDVSIVRFAENYPISVYFDLGEVDMQGRMTHPVRVRNHDHVILPLEPIFDILEIEYKWCEEYNLLHVKGLVQDMVLRPGQAGFATDVLNLQPWELNVNEDAPTLLNYKDSGFYIHSLLFTLMFVYDVSVSSPGGMGSFQPFIPLIYHDLNRVVLASSGRIIYPNFQNKRAAMVIQFNRADFPLDDYVNVVLNGSDIAFTTGSPFPITTRYYDYVMMPAVELLELLGVDTYLSEYSKGIKIIIDGYEYVISVNEPIFPPQTFDWNLRHIHEIPPMLIDDILYISHTDISRMLMLEGVHTFLNHMESNLQVTVWNIS